MTTTLRAGAQLTATLMVTAVLGAAQGAPRQMPATAPAPQQNLQQIPGATTPAQPNGLMANQTGPVSLDVVVDDKKGNPTGGLEQKDFTLLDNGQPRPLVGFRAVNTTAQPDAVHVVIVVDMINSSFERIAYEREQLGEFLTQNGGELPHPTTIAVMTERGVSMMGGSTQDGNALNTNFRKVGTDLRMIGRDAGFYGATERIETSLTELRQIVHYASAMPGRKMVVIITPGWPLLQLAGEEEDMAQHNWMFNVVTQISTELRTGHVALYSIDPLELGRTDPFLYQAYLKPVKRPQQAQYPTMALQVFAEHSGGRALTMGRDVRGELNVAMRDAGPYYELTFNPSPADKPNEYHELQVKVDQPGLVARTNAGFYERVEPVGGTKTISPSKAPKPF